MQNYGDNQVWHGPDAEFANTNIVLVTTDSGRASHDRRTSRS